MATVAAPATPQRPPVPGQWNTPGAGYQSIFGPQAASLRQTTQQAPASTTGTATTSQVDSPIQVAAKTINSALEMEQRFPEMESYITQGISGEYELPSSPAWLPFQKLKMHDLPPKLLEQANYSGMGMMMGIFPPVKHAWVALDNCLYLWDYTLPNPEIIGFEELTQPITAVKLVPPKPGVFISDIRHMIVICTANDMSLLGVAAQITSTGAQTIALYNTRMSIPIKGVGVGYIEASRKTGRIFFTGSLSDDIFEFQYQQEEGWFRGKCSRINHTKNSMNFVSENIHAVGKYFGPQPPTRKQLRQLVIDDTRNIMYSLSTTSEIKVWLIKERLEQSLTRPLSSLLQGTGHFSSRTELLTAREVRLVSISALPAAEARKISLMATTNTGCRLYLSLTRGYGYQVDAQNAPSSMQILHIRYPPKDPNATTTTAQQNQTALTAYNQPTSQVDTNSDYLKPTTMAYRFSPGYWMAFQPHPSDPDTKDRVFCSATDMARLQNTSDNTPLTSKFSEFGQWIDLPSEMQQVQSMTGDFGATGDPTGFGNELAAQYDTAASEFAIVTTTGVQTIRRRRLVDIFAGMMKYGSSDDEGLEGDIKKFIRIYGRAETAATALAVACGQGMDVAESRVANVTDPEVLEKARRAFIEHGGKPDYNTNAVVGNNGDPVQNVRASPRHDGMALYISRLVRSIWKVRIIKDSARPGAASQLESAIPVARLRSIQRDLTALKDFLDRNKSFIEGLAGPRALSKANTVQEERALQGEHKYMYSLLQLINSISEGISFVLTLFDETLEEILALLPEDSRNRTKELTFENLFCSPGGRDLAKELVKAIVNRNIANGSNVDTVAEALRRKCGSFCSSDDVVIFKAQEQVKRASETGSETEGGRVLLNESARLFQKVAASLTHENLESAVQSYVAMAFYAGAIQICLTVALEKDKSKRALAWMKEGKPADDEREKAFQSRQQCYELIFYTIAELEKATANVPDVLDGKSTLETKRRNEAYDLINNSDDVVFLTCLYDWYVQADEADRLLEIENHYVVEYLKIRSDSSRTHADLLWRYYAHHHDYLQAAEVQLLIATSNFDNLPLEKRIEYLSRARTNASTRQTVITDSRQTKQAILRQVSDLLELGIIQDELKDQIGNDTRATPQRRAEIISELNDKILSIDLLFHRYAQSAEYWDKVLLIYQAADHRNPADVRVAWTCLIQDEAFLAPAKYANSTRWEAVGSEVTAVGKRVKDSPAIFPIHLILPLLENFAHDLPRGEQPPENWAVDLLLALDIPHEALLPVLEQIYYSNEHPFVGSKRRLIAAKMVYLLNHWFTASDRNGDRVLFGSEENLEMVQECLKGLQRGEMDAVSRQAADGLIASIAQAMR
ncbi:related to non-repetitive nucleoporin [Lecanosticta acicola]|uniref:Related to non-repetitive nucleoporin n=1 Tax=Lecanosticta acicola TaxID=111012 RepID=A0AAI8Z6K2_9PEZI|nr:related to non-repetitive nucleoporin [Lecanosticta acicola]